MRAVLGPVVPRVPAALSPALPAGCSPSCASSGTPAPARPCSCPLVTPRPRERRRAGVLQPCPRRRARLCPSTLPAVALKERSHTSPADPTHCSQPLPTPEGAGTRPAPWSKHNIGRNKGSHGESTAALRGVEQGVTRECRRDPCSSARTPSTVRPQCAAWSWAGCWGMTTSEGCRGPMGWQGQGWWLAAELLCLPATR